MIFFPQKSLVTATTTRRKQQQEMIRKALLAEEERKRIGRENFPMTTIPLAQHAAYEPLLHHGEEGHEEGNLILSSLLPVTTLLMVLVEANDIIMLTSMSHISSTLKHLGNLLHQHF